MEEARTLGSQLWADGAEPTRCSPHSSGFGALGALRAPKTQRSLSETSPSLAGPCPCAHAPSAHGDTHPAQVPARTRVWLREARSCARHACAHAHTHTLLCHLCALRDLPESFCPPAPRLCASSHSSEAWLVRVLRTRARGGSSYLLQVAGWGAEGRFGERRGCAVWTTGPSKLLLPPNRAPPDL